jgi:hypothetical protein
VQSAKFLLLAMHFLFCHAELVSASLCSVPEKELGKTLSPILQFHVPLSATLQSGLDIKAAAINK